MAPGGKNGNIDFWASSIIIENKGALCAGALSSKKSDCSTQSPARFGAKGSVLTFHLYGPNQAVWDDTNQKFSRQNQGALCKTTQDKANGPCGTPTDGSGIPINGQSISLPGGITDNFYQYGPLYGDGACTPNGLPPYFNNTSGTCSGSGQQVGYFGNKVLAVSYGGTLRLFGYKGTTDDPNLQPDGPGLTPGPSRNYASLRRFRCGGQRFRVIFFHLGLLAGASHRLRRWARGRARKCLWVDGRGSILRGLLTPRGSGDEARDTRERESQNILSWTRCRQVYPDHRFHLDDARGDLDEA